ncbi:unnamed protein product [Phyllotreta striolata]|uniref:Uncharacterized protein n=1 Tax=Phyllotreta striolata TaxID=444603 RepID=A0A9N9TLD1_PHYSR|nr:unnamed protein product [Phyllotreta striolata]
MEKNISLKQSLPKLLCLKKSPVLINTRETRNVNSLKTLDVDTLRKDNCDNYVIKGGSFYAGSDNERINGIDNGKKNRNSVHQNVEEALNSLLWQPYEYQVTRHSHSTSPFSSYCASPSSSYDDLDEITKTDASPSTSCSCRSLADPHPPPSTTWLYDQMVINPLALAAQSPPGSPSRDPTFDERQPSDGATAASRTSGSSTATSRSRSAGAIDSPARPSYVDALEYRDMSSTAASSQQPPPDDNDSNVSTGASLFQSNLSSANVVGLPNHVRYSSVPVQARPSGHNVVPKHSRNVSEPSEHFSRPANNNNNNVVPVNVVNNRCQSVPIVRECNATATTTTSTLVNSSRCGTAGDASFYRAVPVNVISSVPTIHCLNSLQGNEVSNVQVLPLGNPTAGTAAATHQVVLHNNDVTTSITNFFATPCTVSTTSIGGGTNSRTVPTISKSNVQIGPAKSTRTFTSTEAQTDDVPILQASNEPDREQRRRERRERRQQRRLHNNNNNSNRQSVDSSTQIGAGHNDRLPDILNSHLPPPYATSSTLVPPRVLPPPPPPVGVGAAVPQGAVLQTVVPNGVVSNSGFVFQGPPPVVQGAAPVAVPVPPPVGFRFPFPGNGFRRARFSDDPPKGCCGILTWKPGSLRWFIALIALVAVCCVLVGTALGAMRPSGRDHLTVSLLMIGVGIVLVTVSGVAWRLTSHDSSTCRSMLGLGSTESVEVCARRFVPRLPPAYGRPHHPYAAMMYPEFQYRPPPPSYQASMQEYRLRLLLLERGNTPQIQGGLQNAVSPPPTYRSHSGSLLRVPMSCRREAAQSEYSCPPSYRSQSTRPGTVQSNSALHSREQSLSLSESNHGESMVNVVNILTGGGVGGGVGGDDLALDNITLDSLKMEPEHEHELHHHHRPVKVLLKGGGGGAGGDFADGGGKEGNLVTIVQTGDRSPVIVTVSGHSQIDSNSTVQITEVPTEIEILAHL